MTYGGHGHDHEGHAEAKQKNKKVIEKQDTKDKKNQKSNMLPPASGPVKAAANKKAPKKNQLERKNSSLLQTQPDLPADVHSNLVDDFVTKQSSSQ